MLESEDSRRESRIAEEREHYKRMGFALIHYDDDAIHSYPYDAPWLTDDAPFNRLYERIRKHTLVDRVRCYALYQLAGQARKVPGNILEVGVWRGGTAALLAHTAPEKTVYAADTFRGVVKAADWEHYVDGAHADTSREVVIDLLKGKVGAKNYVILEGIFPEETGSAVSEEAFSLVHIDVDVYESARDVYEFVWNKMTVGGVIVFDDYGMISACPGISRLVNELAPDGNKLFLPGPSGQAYIVKLPAH